MGTEFRNIYFAFSRRDERRYGACVRLQRRSDDRLPLVQRGAALGLRGPHLRAVASPSRVQDAEEHAHLGQYLAQSLLPHAYVSLV